MGLGVVVDLDEAIEAGVVSDNATGISIMARHALLAQAVRDTISPERRSEVYRALAEVMDGYRALRHALRSEERRVGKEGRSGTGAGQYETKRGRPGPRG